GRRDEGPAGRLRDALQQHREQIVLGKRLATIVTDLPIGFDPEVCRLKDYDSEEVRRLFQDYEFMSLVPRLPKNRAANGSAQEPRSATAVAQPGATAPSDGGGGQLSFFVPTAAPRQGSLEVEAKLVENAAALRTLLDGWPADKSVAVSLALEAAAWRRAPLAGIALADATRAWYVPLRGEQDGGSGAMLGVLRESWPRRELTAHSLKQLELALGPRGFPPPGGFDVS